MGNHLFIRIEMRVAIVVGTFPESITSPEMWLAVALQRLGHTVSIITTTRRGSRDRYLDRLGEEYDASTYLKVRLRSLPLPYREMAFPFGLSKEMVRSFDLLLLQEDYTTLSQLAARVARATGVPYLVTFERYAEYGSAVVRSVMKILDATLNKRVRAGARALTFHTFASMRFIASQGVCPPIVKYTPAFTDTDFFNPGSGVDSSCLKELGWTRASALRILTIARPHPAKGLDTLLEVAERLLATGLDFQLLLHSLGPGARALAPRVRQMGLADRLLVNSVILSPRELRALYRSADLYVQPSLHEPFGMSVLEAMACGVPVVASNVGGLGELVKSETSGYLVPPGSVNDTAGAIASLASDPSLRTAMAKASRERAVTLFNLRSGARDYESLFREF